MADILGFICMNKPATLHRMQKNRILQFLLIAFLILLAGFASADDRNLLPKYGSLPKEESQKSADAAFIAATDEEYHGDRKKASADSAARGWQYLHQGNTADAMRRFNQAWLLNASNGIALWGMAAIEADSGKFDSSLSLFVEAEKLVGADLNFTVDYARALGLAGATLHDEMLLKFAWNRFESNYKKALQNARNLRNWAMTLFAIGKYADAWSKVKLAEATPNKGDLDPQFLAELQSKMPRPPN